MTKVAMPLLLKSVVAAGTLLTLGGCMVGGSGYYGDGYVNNRSYGCDPYAPFDDYYACDYGYGFANIGYGGGWYDQYYYPGYGIYIFDRGGKRHAMRDNHRRHWARQRAQYGGRYARDRNRSPEQRAVRRDRRYERSDDGQRTGRNGVRQDRRQPATADRRVRQDQATPTRNRGERAQRTNRRATPAAEQRQARPQPATRPSRASTPPQTQSRRVAPRTSRTERRNVSDD